jgi:hypothetical protein
MLRSFWNFTLCHRPRWSDTATMAVIVAPGLPTGLSKMTSQLAFEIAFWRDGKLKPIEVARWVSRHHVVQNQMYLGTLLPQ